MRVQFIGAAGTVTGSQTLLTHRHQSILIDCGLYQGPKALRELNWTQPSHLQDVSAIVLTHAHIDHSGLIPRWTHWGWRGKIYCTKATADLLSVMLLDSARLQQEDAGFANTTKHSKHSPALPLYTEEDVFKALDLLHPLDYEQPFSLSPHWEISFSRAGHILGSASVSVRYSDGEKTKSIVFSGDLGGGHSDLLKDPLPPSHCNDLVLESTYGDRMVDPRHREEDLAEVVNKVHSRQGTLVVPAFSLGRTQDLLFSLFRLRQQRKIPQVPVYLDSPMARAVTKIYLRNLAELRFESLRTDIEQALSGGSFSTVDSPDESMLLCLSDEPKIVLSASGMLQGGRVLHHLKCKLPGAQNGVLFVGYQGAETKGRLLQDGASSLRLHHQEIDVRAQIFTIEGYSAHGDARDLIHWVQRLREKPQRVFLNHGEPAALNTLAASLRAELEVETVIPTTGQSFQITENGLP